MVKGEADKRKSQAPHFYRRETIRLLELRPCFASHKSSIVRCSEATRMLRFPSSAYRLQPTQATFSPPTTHLLPACNSTLAPALYSDFPQTGTERHAQKARPRDAKGGVRTGCFDTTYLSWRCKKGGQRRTGENGIQALLHSVVMAALLFMCVPPSEEEAALIGSRCEKDGQETG